MVQVGKTHNKGRKIMEKLEKQIQGIFIQFFREEAGNRLSQFAWASFQETVLKMVRDYKNENKTK